MALAQQPNKHFLLYLSWMGGRNLNPYQPLSSGGSVSACVLQWEKERRKDIIWFTQTTVHIPNRTTELNDFSMNWLTLSVEVHIYHWKQPIILQMQAHTYLLSIEKSELQLAYLRWTSNSKAISLKAISLKLFAVCKINRFFIGFIKVKVITARKVG